MTPNRIAITLVVCASVWVAPVAFGQACTLLKLDAKKGADLVVYFTKFKKEDTTRGRFRRCRLVKKKGTGTKAFWITPFRQDASVVVHRSNWPR